MSYSKKIILSIVIILALLIAVFVSVPSSDTSPSARDIIRIINKKGIDNLTGKDFDNCNFHFVEYTNYPINECQLKDGATLWVWMSDPDSFDYSSGKVWHVQIRYSNGKIEDYVAKEWLT